MIDQALDALSDYTWFLARAVLGLCLILGLLMWPVTIVAIVAHGIGVI